MNLNILSSKTEIVGSGNKEKIVTPITSIDSHAGHFNIYVVYFFKGSPDIEEMKKALSKTIADFPEIEGRYSGKRNDKIEIVSCGEGIKFIIETTSFTIEEAQRDEVKRENWEKLVENINFSELIDGKGAGMAVKVISYKNGGYSIGITVNHALTDAGGFYYFIECWSKNFRGEEYKKPLLNRSLFEKNPGKRDKNGKGLERTEGFMCLTEEETEEHYKMYMELDPLSIENKVIQFSALELKNMKKEGERELRGNGWISTNDIFSMHLWQIFNKISDSEEVANKLFLAVNIREKSNPKLGKEYFGNGSLPIVMEKQRSELMKKSTALLAAEVRERVNQYDSAKIAEQVMWMKEKQGIHVFADFNPFKNEINISSFAKFPVFSAEFGTGRAFDAYIPPVICPGVIRVMPRADKDGVDLYLSMYKKDMKKLDSKEWRDEMHKYKNIN